MVDLSDLTLSRRSLLLGGLSVGALSLTGCGGPAPTPAAGDEEGELTIITPIFEGNDGKQLLDEADGGVHRAAPEDHRSAPTTPPTPS